MIRLRSHDLRFSLNQFLTSVNVHKLCSLKLTEVNYRTKIKIYCIKHENFGEETFVVWL